MRKDFGKISGNDCLAILQKTHAEQVCSMAEKRRQEGSGATAISAIYRIHLQFYLGLVKIYPLPSALTRNVGWRPASTFLARFYGHVNCHISLMSSTFYIDSEGPKSKSKRFLHRQKVNSFTQADRCPSPLTLLVAEGKSGRGRDLQLAHAKLLEGPFLPWLLRLGNATTSALVGYFLEQHQEALGVNETTLKDLENLRPRGRQYLDRSAGGRLAKRWNLIVPDAIWERHWEELR